jgi:dTDP-4-amino-4,6-dideoxygalactose transaminase
MELLGVYRRRLSRQSEWKVPFGDHPGESAGHLAVAVAPDPATRDAAAGLLNARGIQTSMHYPCIADFTAFRQFAAPQLDRSREFASRAITLPLFPTMTFEQVEEVCSVLTSVASRQPSIDSVRA